MRQRQSRRLKNQAKKARERRVATFLRYLEKRNARRGTPRRSLRIALQRDGAPPRVILFGEEGFFADNEAGIGPPKEADYRIREIESDDEEDISTAKEESKPSISLNEATSSDLSSSLSLSASAPRQQRGRHLHRLVHNGLHQDSGGPRPLGIPTFCRVPVNGFEFRIRASYKRWTPTSY